MNGGDKPVTVDTLDAALARLELRLVGQFASVAHVAALEARVVSKEAVKQIVIDVLHESEARGWTRRDSLLAVVGIVFVALTFVLSLYTATRGG